MFENIEQLEKEIQAFRQNILASSELVKSMEEISAVVRKQQSDYAESSSALLDKMEQQRTELAERTATLLDQIEKLSKSVPEEVEKKAEVLIEQLKDVTATYEKTMSGIVEQFEKENNDNTAEALRKYGELNGLHIEQLKKAEEQISAMISDLNEKYNLFLTRLESTNIDSLFSEIQKMKKSMEAKMYLILGGVGIAIVIAIVSLIIR